MRLSVVKALRDVWIFHYLHLEGREKLVQKLEDLELSILRRVFLETLPSELK